VDRSGNHQTLWAAPAVSVATASGLGHVSTGDSTLIAAGAAVLSAYAQDHFDLIPSPT
jgi:hypothetical protein